MDPIARGRGSTSLIGDSIVGAGLDNNAITDNKDRLALQKKAKPRMGMTQVRNF